MNWRNLIQITPGVRGEKPTLLGTRITPTDILEYLAGRMTEDQILKDFPSLTREHIRAVFGLCGRARASEHVTPSFGQNCCGGVSGPPSLFHVPTNAPKQRENEQRRSKNIRRGPLATFLHSRL
jgi:uncharacterized protein (DUF433 family)